MAYDIVFDGLPIGYSLSAVKGGEKVSIVTTEFTSSEDGDVFIRRLEGYPTIFLSLAGLPSKVVAPTVDHLLVILRRDSSGIVYVNELALAVSIKAKRDITQGENVLSDDIAEVEALSFGGVTIPNDAGFLVLFSCGWRKGLFFDFSPLTGDEPHLRDYEVEKLIGRYYAYLSFQHLFKISDTQWQQLVSQHWFPFISLKEETVKKMLGHLDSGWPIDDLLENIANEIEDNADIMRSRWGKNLPFRDHLTVLEKALDRFLQKDYMSATALLYPRIEGIMRSYHQSLGASTSPSAKNLVTSVVEKSEKRDLLLPDRFDAYLRSVYFASFGPASPSILSRHSVAHGVAPTDLFDLKGAILGLLILEQLSFFMT